MVGESHQKIELGGKLSSPVLCRMHQHLDKSRTRRLVQNPTGDIPARLRAIRPSRRR